MIAPDLTCPVERERRIERYVSVAAMPAGSPGVPSPRCGGPAGFGVPGTLSGAAASGASNPLDITTPLRGALIASVDGPDTGVPERGAHSTNEIRCGRDDHTPCAEPGTPPSPVAAAAAPREAREGTAAAPGSTAGVATGAPGHATPAG